MENLVKEIDNLTTQLLLVSETNKLLRELNDVYILENNDLKGTIAILNSKLEESYKKTKEIMDKWGYATDQWEKTNNQLNECLYIIKMLRGY